MVYGTGFCVSGLGLRDRSGVGARVSSFGFRVQNVGSRVATFSPQQRRMPPLSKVDLISVKLTIHQFYKVAGQSTK